MASGWIIIHLVMASRAITRSSLLTGDDTLFSTHDWLVELAKPTFYKLGSAAQSDGND